MLVNNSFNDTPAFRVVSPSPMFRSQIALIKTTKSAFSNHITTNRQDKYKEILQIIHERIIFTLRLNNNADLYVNWSLKVVLVTKYKTTAERNGGGNVGM